ncbi:hypothetical protein BBW65_00735 [Helicobacter enhydrae]|uniref:Uncharacterized protein n=1 Tax=Helicobacter enhydrae TaxID=222136 RepID=A0A1B1U3V0_9HELI|nr:hypothetical protein BBW65_00735 [Helicobacter enhydrae]
MIQNEKKGGELKQSKGKANADQTKLVEPKRIPKLPKVLFLQNAVRYFSFLGLLLPKHTF